MDTDTLAQAPLSHSNLVAWLRFLADELERASNVDIECAVIDLRLPTDIEPLFRAWNGRINRRGQHEECRRVLSAHLALTYRASNG